LLASGPSLPASRLLSGISLLSALLTSGSSLLTSLLSFGSCLLLLFRYLFWSYGSLPFAYTFHQGIKLFLG
jgi:hypothetical protein